MSGLPFLNMDNAVRRPSANDNATEPPSKKRKVVSHSQRITGEQFVSRLAVTQEKADIISNYEQKSEDWLDARKGRITASNFGSAIGKNKYQSRRGLLKQMLWHTFRGCAATRWGCEKEEVALDVYVNTKQIDIASAARVADLENATDEEKDEIVTDLWVEERGLVINPERPWMGNSPDGIVHTTYASGRKELALLEIKCPFKKTFYPPEPEPPNYPVPPQYMCQIQGTMGNLGLPWCDFVVWTPTETQITRVPFDPNFWNDIMLPGLTDYYFNDYVPAAVNQENGLLEDGETEIAIDIDLRTTQQSYF